MKENVLEVLLYLYENYISEQPELLPEPDELIVELEEAGFARSQIDGAFYWLQEIEDCKTQDSSICTTAGMRVYTTVECQRLNAKCRGFLLSLEQMGLLNPEERELVIDRLFSLNVEVVDFKVLKWLVFVVILNKPELTEGIKWLVALDKEEDAVNYH